MLRFLNTKTILEVLLFLYGHWKREWRLVLQIALGIVIATIADLFLPVFSGRLVDAITPRGVSREQAFQNALYSIAAMAVLGAVLIGGRHRLPSGLSLDGAAHVPNGVGRFLARAAPFYRLARQYFCRIDCAPHHARHVGG